MKYRIVLINEYIVEADNAGDAEDKVCELCVMQADPALLKADFLSIGSEPADGQRFQNIEEARGWAQLQAGGQPDWSDLEGEISEFDEV